MRRNRQALSSRFQALSAKRFQLIKTKPSPRIKNIKGYRPSAVCLLRSLLSSAKPIFSPCSERLRESCLLPSILTRSCSMHARRYGSHQQSDPSLLYHGDGPSDLKQAGLPTSHVGPFVRELPAGGHRRITKGVVPDFEAKRGAALQGPGQVVPLGPPESQVRESTGIHAVPRKRQVPVAEHRPVTALERGLQAEARYYQDPAAFAARHARGGASTDAFKGTAIKASLNPEAPPPPPGTVEGLQYRRRGSASAIGNAIREDHVADLLQPSAAAAADSATTQQQLEGAKHATSEYRARTFDVKQRSDNIRGVLDPSYSSPALEGVSSGGGSLHFGLGGSVAGTGGMTRRVYTHAQSGDQAALLMLHNPSLLPADFKDEDAVKRGKALSGSSVLKADNVGLLLAEPSARAAAVATARSASTNGSPTNAAAAGSSSHSSSSSSSSSSEAVYGMLGHQRGEKPWAEPQALSQPATAALFYSAGGGSGGSSAAAVPQSPALIIPGQARILKYSRDLEGSRGIITGTRAATPIDDRPKTAGPLLSTTANDSVGAIARGGQPVISGPNQGVQPQDVHGNPLGSRSIRGIGNHPSYGGRGSHLHSSGIQFG
jgi:hypothetical protein